MTFELLAFNCIKLTYYVLFATFIRDHFRNIFLISQLIMSAPSWVHGNRVLGVFLQSAQGSAVWLRIGFEHLLSSKTISLGLCEHREQSSHVAKLKCQPAKLRPGQSCDLKLHPPSQHIDRVTVHSLCVSCKLKYRVVATKNGSHCGMLNKPFIIQSQCFYCHLHSHS